MSETSEVVVVDVVADAVVQVVAVTLPVHALLIPHTPVSVVIGLIVTLDSDTTLMLTTTLMHTMELVELKLHVILKILSVLLTTLDVTATQEFLLVVSWVASCSSFF